MHKNEKFIPKFYDNSYLELHKCIKILYKYILT